MKTKSQLKIKLYFIPVVLTLHKKIFKNIKTIKKGTFTLAVLVSTATCHRYSNVIEFEKFDFLNKNYNLVARRHRAALCRTDWQ